MPIIKKIYIVHCHRTSNVLACFSTLQTKISLFNSTLLITESLNLTANFLTTNQMLTRCHIASWAVKASGRLTPFIAIQSISRSQRVQFHHTKE